MCNEWQCTLLKQRMGGEIYLILMCGEWRPEPFTLLFKLECVLGIFGFEFSSWVAISDTTSNPSYTPRYNQ
jgi:hypothetical protein